MRKVVVNLSICFLLTYSTSASFSFGFRKFLLTAYGTDVQANLTRLDFLERGSFGGGIRSYPAKTNHTPVIFVHGLTNVAGDYHEAFAEFMRRGYLAEEIYATTYGPYGSPTNYSCSLECGYVKQIRQLIIAVSTYTQSKVHVIANSLGGPITRKAILGGYCVDTIENLGGPLTELVDTFFGVAGAFKGSLWCSMFPADLFPLCSDKTGLKIGSVFLNDTNKIKGYEGQRILILESAEDDMIGFQDSRGQRLMEVDMANRTIILRNVTHERTVFGTQGLQYDLLILDKPYPPGLVVIKN
ncbi:LIPaSe related [Aphelenchoides bicaudatus]|nr:LIPaSe related [Aphelenchoides bicaudatus]